MDATAGVADGAGDGVIVARRAGPVRLRYPEAPELLSADGHGPAPGDVAAIVITQHGGDAGVPGGTQARCKCVTRQVPAEAGTDGHAGIGKRSDQRPQPVRLGPRIRIGKNQHFGLRSHSFDPAKQVIDLLSPAVRVARSHKRDVRPCGRACSRAPAGQFGQPIPRWVLL